MARSTTGLAYATLGASILGGVVVLVFLTVPSWTTLRDARALLVAQQAKRDQHQQFLKDIDARTAELLRYEKDARVLAVMLPDSEAPADLLAVIADLAQRNGMTILSVNGPAPKSASSAQAAVGGPARQTFETTLSVRGTYAGMSGFLRGVESSARLVDVPSVLITGSPEGIAGTLTLVTVSVPRPDPSAPLPGVVAPETETKGARS